MEINRTCSNYKVQLSENKTYQSEIIKNIEDADALFAFDGKGSFHNRDDSNQEASSSSVAYLNVHSGLSVGVMASIDIGFRDRWEYILLGTPLQDVAVAEGEAGSGELVISAIAHECLHHPSAMQTSTCSDYGCIALESGCFKVTTIPHISPRLVDLKAPSVDEAEDELAYGTTVLQSCESEVESAMSYAFDSTLHDLPTNQQEVAKQRLTERIQYCFMDDIMRHVHTAPRADYSFHNYPRYMEHMLHELSDIDESPSPPDSGESSKVQSTKHRTLSSLRSSIGGLKVNSSLTPKKSFVDKIRDDAGMKYTNLKKQYQSTKKNNVAIQDNTMISELREVIVMFINLHIPHLSLDLYTDPKETIYRTCQIEGFHFLDRTFTQLQGDHKLLYMIENCMKTMTDGMKRHSGHLRQFIIDDKGTVGIGTWGLKGSMSNDVAADALQSARAIVDDLRKIQITASIGLTSGQVYCGLVGSPIRHEYAVMGPSVNLSARLMGKCKSYEILCDSVIRGRDRAHLYSPFAKLNAKGYSQPVETFKPVFQHNSKTFQLAPTLKSLGNVLSDQEIEKDKLNNAKNKLKRLQTASRMVGLVSSMTGRSVGGNGGNTEEEIPDTTRKLRTNVIRASLLLTSTTKKIHGRKIEIQQIMKLIAPNSEKAEELLMNVAIMDAMGTMPATLAAVQALNDDGTRLFPDPSKQPSKMIIISGVGGIGKTFIANHVCVTLMRLAVHKKYWNISVQSNNITSDSGRGRIDPFASWKSIFVNILAELDHSHEHDNDPRRERLLVSYEPKHVKALYGLESMISLLPDNLQKKTSLLACICNIFTRKDEGSLLIGPQRIDTTFDLFINIIHIVRDKRNVILFFPL